jgi:hypothetical protein
VTKKLLYFGCIRESGHFLWQTERYHHHARQTAALIPGLNPRVLEVLDGVFTPWIENGREIEGLYQESIVPPVRIVAWWDRSIDTRGACNSALVGFGFASAEEMLDAAAIQFPSVMARQKRPVPLTSTPVEKGSS